MDNFYRRLNRQRWEEVCQLEQRSLERNRQMLQQLEEYDRLNVEMTVKTERLKKEREKLLNGTRQNYHEWPNITHSTNQQQLPIFATPLNSNTSISMHQANMKEFWKKTNGQEWIKRNARTCTPVVSSNISLEISSKLNDSKILERKPKIVIDSPLLASKQISQTKPPIHPKTLLRTKTENMSMLKQTKSVSKDVDRIYDTTKVINNKIQSAEQSNGHVVNVINEDKAINNAHSLVETQRESVLNTNEVVMDQLTTGTEMPNSSQIGLNVHSAIAIETLADNQIHRHAIDSPSLSTIEETPSKDNGGSEERDQHFNNDNNIKSDIVPMADVVSVKAIGEDDACGTELIEVDALVIESNSNSNDNSNQINVNDKCEAEELDDNQIMKSNKDIVVEDSSTSPPLDYNTRVQSHETTDSQMVKVEAEKELKPSILSFLPSDEDEDDDDDSFFEMSKVAQLPRKSIQEIPTMELQTRAEEVEDNESSDETEDILSQMGINKGLSQQLVTQNTFAAVETLGLAQQPTETLIKTVEVNNRPPQLAQKLANYLGRDSSVIGGKSQQKEVEIQKVADKTEDDDFDFFD